ncbi:hypothetical protein EDD15DRAFT_2308858 [Pisolithus albus]|nr:hypothetical protein EDD15DRAFT_2308858 [Pisolithus albus]
MSTGPTPKSSPPKAHHSENGKSCETAGRSSRKGQNEITIREKLCKQNQKRDKNRPRTHPPIQTTVNSPQLPPTTNDDMAPISTGKAGEVQTTTIVGIVLGLGEYLGQRTVACSLCVCPSRIVMHNMLVCFIGLTVAIWTVPKCFSERDQGSPPVRISCVSPSCSAIDFVVEAGGTSDVIPG